MWSYTITFGSIEPNGMWPIQMFFNLVVLAALALKIRLQKSLKRNENEIK